MNKAALNKLAKIADTIEAFTSEIEALQQRAEVMYDRESDKDTPNDEKIDEYENDISAFLTINDILNDAVITIKETLEY